MNRCSRFLPLLVAALVLGGCTANVATPWDRTSLDPGQIATLEPLEIPPNFDKLPKPGPKKDPAPKPVPNWVDTGERAQSGNVSSLFKAPLSTNESDAISRNEQEQLPVWMGPEVKSE